MIAPETDRVGKFEFSKRRSEKSPESKLRADALANWLLAEWERDQVIESSDASSRNDTRSKSPTTKLLSA